MVSTALGNQHLPELALHDLAVVVRGKRPHEAVLLRSLEPCDAVETQPVEFLGRGRGGNIARNHERNDGFSPLRVGPADNGGLGDQLGAAADRLGQNDLGPFLFAELLDGRGQLVEIAAKTQEEKIKSIRSQQELVTKGIQNEYEAKLAAIRHYYKSTSVWNNPSSGKVSGLSTAPSATDVIAAYNELAGQCAETTAQTIALQDWIRGQIGVK